LPAGDQPKYESIRFESFSALDISVAAVCLRRYGFQGFCNKSQILRLSSSETKGSWSSRGK
jgi:hypothetical protein